VAQIVPAQVLAAERVDYLVPMRRVSEHGGGDPAVARTGEQTGGRVWSDSGNPAGDELAYLDDERHDPSPFAFGALVDHSAR